MKKISNIELRKIQLDILNSLTSFCNENDLLCYLSGGTLLGAIRHEGYIPWDDDIDLNMPRKDFDKLIHLSKEKTFPKHLKLLHCSTDKNFIYPFIKVIDNRTYVNENDDYNNRELGIWVDIFPMDNFYNNYIFSFLLCSIIRVLIKLLFLGSAKISKYKSLILRFSLSIPILLVRIYSSNRIANIINNISKNTNINETNYIGCKVWGYGIKERFITEGYYKPIKVKFEDKLFDAPSNYDVYLKSLFGNYMKLPPMNKRINHNINAYWK